MTYHLYRALRRLADALNRLAAWIDGKFTDESIANL